MCPRGCHLDALRQEGDADQAEALSISSTALVPAGSRIALTVAVANETAKVASLKLAIGDTVMLELSPFDLSKGRITGGKTKA